MINLDMVNEVDEKFRKKYEMDFYSFERVLELLVINGFDNHEYFDKLIDDYLVWKEAIYISLDSVRHRKFNLR